MSALETPQASAPDTHTHRQSGLCRGEAAAPRTFSLSFQQPSRGGIWKESDPVRTEGDDLSLVESSFGVLMTVFHRGNLSISFICSNIYETNICRQPMYLSNSEVIQAYDGGEGSHPVL